MIVYADSRCYLKSTNRQVTCSVTKKHTLDKKKPIAGKYVSGLATEFLDLLSSGTFGAPWGLKPCFRKVEFWGP